MQEESGFGLTNSVGSGWQRQLEGLAWGHVLRNGWGKHGQPTHRRSVGFHKTHCMVDAACHLDASQKLQLCIDVFGFVACENGVSTTLVNTWSEFKLLGEADWSSAFPKYQG